VRERASDNFEVHGLQLSSVRGAAPLYVQIKDLLVFRISNGQWSPGELIPSEIQLAQELGVSQGTVRKAISELVEKNVLTRKQGRGTFVAYHDSERSLFHFFHIVDNDGHKVMPESETLSCRRKRASRVESSRLQLAPGASVVSIERIRQLDGQPVILENIALPSEPFARLGRMGACDLPNMLYELYEKDFGITIYNAEEQLRAVPASEHDAALLNIAPETPLLEIDRIALTLDNTPVELRVSRCITRNHHYRNTIF
jgi:GntR family transcriptional regulator